MVSHMGMTDPVSTSDRKTSSGRLQSWGRSRGRRSCVSQKSENSERNACVKSYEGRSSKKVKTCASGTEESRDKRVVHVRAVEAAESEIAEARRKVSKSPSFIVPRAEEKRVLEDLCKGGVVTGGDKLGG